jgi:hypothetical protein
MNQAVDDSGITADMAGTYLLICQLIYRGSQVNMAMHDGLASGGSILKIKALS